MSRHITERSSCQTAVNSRTAGPLRWRCSSLAFLFVLLFTSASRAQTAPSLTLTIPAPGLVELSWSTNFPNWQLMSSTNVSSPTNWQPVAGPTNQFGTTFAVFYAVTNKVSFFRLQQNGGGGGYPFQATPPVIVSGGSSTLSWATNPATTYEIFPGAVFVNGTNYVVSPANTTIYTLVASNTTGVVSNTTTVTVTSPACPFQHASGWDCTLTFSYTNNARSASDIFVIDEFAFLSFHFSLVTISGNLAIYKAVLLGDAGLNDSETQGSNPIPITVSGTDTPKPGQSGNLTINCGTGTYTFDIQPVISANWSGTMMDTRVGSVYGNNFPLPATLGPLSYNGTLPARGPTWSGGGSWYFPGGLGFVMFTDGAVTDTTAGNADVSWTFTLSP